MYLQDFFANDDGIHINKLSRASTTYNACYLYWRDQLFERVMRLMVWEGTESDNEKMSIKPKEIEARLILKGHCGVTKISATGGYNYTVDDKLAVMFGSFFGVTEYYDEWSMYNVRCPIFAGKRTIGKDIVVINNNSIRNPIYPLIHHYAVMLAHTEVTLINTMINARDAGGVPIASTEKQKRSIEAYQGRLFNGQYGVVTDVGMLGIEYAGTNRMTAQPVRDIMETREKLIKSFYSDIGVRSAFEKRNNTVQAEVEADTSLLLLNLADMIKCREKGCEEVNKMFGTNWSVHVAEEIDYGDENQRIQFDTSTEIHAASGYESGVRNSEQGVEDDKA